MVGTVAVPERDRLDEAALSRWMSDHVDGFVGPLTLTKFKGGQSNPTYRIDTPKKTYVLRRQPFGELLPSAHAVDREFRIISALFAQGFSVPRPFGLCKDPDVLGAMFYLMALADGRNYWDGALPDRSPLQRTAIYHAMIDTLADLHRFDPAAIGLAEYGKPGAYCERQVARWTRQYRLSETGELPAMDRLIEWLPTAIPVQHGETIVHGDFRLDNLIFDTEGQVAAVLDWELSTLGDPLADFAYLAMNWIAPPDGRAGIAGLDWAALGIPTLEQATRRYCARTGLPAPDLDWYFAFNLFRLAGIVQGIKKRIIDGTASSARAEAMARMVEPLATRGWEFATRAGARG